MNKIIFTAIVLACSSACFAENCTVRPTGNVETTVVVPANPPGSCFGWDASLTRGLRYGDYAANWWSRRGNQPHGIQLTTTDPTKIANPISSNLENKPGNIVTKTINQ